jgi:hypothetical protein
MKKELTDFCCFEEFRMTNDFIKHKGIHKFKWQARNTKSVTDYTTGNEKMTTIVNDVRVYRSVELNTDHYLLSTRLSFPPGRVNKQNAKKQGNKLQKSLKFVY